MNSQRPVYVVHELLTRTVFGADHSEKLQCPHHGQPMAFAVDQLSGAVSGVIHPHHAEQCPVQLKFGRPERSILLQKLFPLGASLGELHLYLLQLLHHLEGGCFHYLQGVHRGVFSVQSSQFLFIDQPINAVAVPLPLLLLLLLFIVQTICASCGGE